MRADNIQLPLIPIINELIINNPNTISLGQGVVFYPPPDETFKEIDKFAGNPQNNLYQSINGINKLLEEIETKLAQDNQINYSQNRSSIFVTAGSNMAFMNAVLAITNPEDEIIILAPYYFNHEMAIRLANCKPIIVDTNNQYQPDIDQIINAITPKTKAIVTISPNNPTGVVYSKKDLLAINIICKEKGIYHISDEAYEYFTYNGIKHYSPASFVDSDNHTISLFSLSKAYGFASWRIGYMVIPKHLEMAVKKIQDTILICPPVISQYGAYGALKIGKNYCQKYLLEINKVREKMLDSLAKISNICEVSKSDGAFYLFLKIKSDMNSFELTKKLIENYRVAVIPGTTFGVENKCCLRVAYGALNYDTASIGINRLVEGLSQLIEV
ncbi:pyridoxal phosphate-dependent aminotransferase [Cyanobacterium aponinum AL20118]|uniref:Aspartate transaminase n=2 Tax=Cyanobacterium aponinum TaxID=379064 RepID=K9Z120_CYAAP|nr:pyridoxal phosphate-dependent aminotransferase [Cyanobacterium aponinum]AFZ52255.1 Aspartate transaminase [Cyanobacterium aponinum PCC 10605]WPF88785.1 pyridoxal phosphate-dependent aminotransferase [Cyanobacterium aponinum AL20115]